MATKATNAVTSDAYIQIKRTLTQLKLNVDAMITQVQAINSDYAVIQGIYDTLTRAFNQVDGLKATPGLDAWAKDQEDNPAYAFDTELQATLDAISGAQAWVAANVPLSDRTLKPVSEWLTAATIIADEFTPAQTGGLVTELQAVTVAIS